MAKIARLKDIQPGQAGYTLKVRPNGIWDGAWGIEFWTWRDRSKNCEEEGNAIDARLKAAQAAQDVWKFERMGYNTVTFYFRSPNGSLFSKGLSSSEMTDDWIAECKAKVKELLGVESLEEML